MSIQYYPSSKLQHGDVLLYEYIKRQSIFEKGIRTITGSKFVHAGIVQHDKIITNDNYFILEQLTQERIHSWLQFYYSDYNQIIHVVRPKFVVPEVNKKLFERRKYGYSEIVDCMINHFIGLFNKSYKYRQYFSKNSKNHICSVVVGMSLKLDKNSDWCDNLFILEPDDYYNHSESFDYLGIVDWTK